MKKLSVLLCSICAVLILVVLPFISACAKPAPAPAPTPSPAPAPAPEKPIEIRYGVYVPLASRFCENVAVPWVNQLNQEGKGKIHATLYPAGVLAKAYECYEATVKGLQDMTFIVPIFTPEHFPLTTVNQIPFEANNSVIGTQILNGPLWDKYLYKEYEKVKVLGRTQSAPYNVFSRKPVRTLEDFKGQRLHVGGGLLVKIVESLDGIPVKIPSPEAYEAVHRGTIDGSMFFYGQFSKYKFWEVVDYVTETKFGGGPVMHIMNKDFWESLPRDVQLIIEYVSKDMGMRDAWAYYNVDQTGKQEFIEHGVEIITLSPEEINRMKEAMQPAIDNWIDELEKKGYPGQEIYEFYLSQVEIHTLPR